MGPRIQLRPCVASDDAFLIGLYRRTHEEMFNALEIPRDQLEQILQTQFAAQQEHYRAVYPKADFDLVILGSEPIGNLYALRGLEQYVLVDINLLPDQRNSGIGSHLVEQLISEAQAARKPVHAKVRRGNPAWRLWQRLGFKKVYDDGVYLSIEYPLKPGR